MPYKFIYTHGEKEEGPGQEILMHNTMGGVTGQARAMLEEENHRSRTKTLILEPNTYRDRIDKKIEKKKSQNLAIIYRHYLIGAGSTF